MHNKKLMNRRIKPEDRGWNKALTDKNIEYLAGDGFCISPCTRNAGAFAYRLTCNPAPNTQVTIYISMGDWQVKSDVTITNMTVLPEEFRNRGHGTNALKAIIRWAARHSYNEIRATQVNNIRTKKFWLTNGFVREPEPNRTSDYILLLNK